MAKNRSIYLIWFFFLVFSLLTVNYIELPFSNPDSIISRATIHLKYNVKSNLFRYIYLVFFPVLVAGLYSRFIKFKRINTEKNTFSDGDNRLFKLSALLLIVWGVLKFILFYTYSFLPSVPDFLGEGESLSTALNYKISGKFWSSSFMAHGPFFDMFSTWLGWKFFGFETIGASRSMHLFLTSLMPLFFSAFVFFLSIHIRKRRGPEAASIALCLFVFAFIFTGGVFLDFMKFNEFFSLNYSFEFPFSIKNLVCFERRDLPVLASLTVFLWGVLSGRNFLFFLAGILNVAAFFYSIDRGSFLTLAYFSTAIWYWFFLKDKISCFIYIIFGFLFGVILWFLFFGYSESVLFIKNTFFWIQYSDITHSGLFPDPAQNAWAYRLPLFFISLGFLRLFVFFRRDLIEFLLLALSFFYFRGALTRPDVWHFVYVSAFSFLLGAYILWTHIDALKFDYKRMMTWLCLFVLFCVDLVYVGTCVENFDSFFSISSRMNKFNALPDRDFLDFERRANYEQLLALFKDEPCSYVFSNEALWHYLLKKQSCSRFYIAYTAALQKYELEVIADLEVKRPKRILYSSFYQSFKFPYDDLDGIRNEVRLPSIHEYLLKNFKTREQAGSTLVLSR